MKVPFVDLHAQYLSIKSDIDTAISDVIKNTSFIGGGAIKEFEAAFGSYCGVKHVIACANGTDSLEMILQAWGIGAGDEVIVPAHSWISTSEAVSSVGARPVFVDVEEDYYTIDPNLVEAAITSKTKAIIPVHLFGHPADMPAILEISKRHGLKVLEDCAQAHGATINGQMVGSFGDAASFSFYPGKNLGAYGDAGCMTTNDDILAEKVRMIANHGQKGKHNHQMEGRNSRLDGLQAAILLAKLPHLKHWTNLRQQHAVSYNQLLGDSTLVLPKEKKNYTHVYHLYVVKVADRPAVINRLNSAAIETAIHYPVALPFLPCYQYQENRVEGFPVAFGNQSKILSIPMYPELTEEHITAVANSLLKY